MSKRTKELGEERRKLKTKKIIMIIILIVFLVAIGIVLAQVNKKSAAKINEGNNTENIDNTATSSGLYGPTNIESPYSTDEGQVRKSADRAVANPENMVTITDNYFIEQTNDFYYNMEDYIGMTVKLEGLIYSYDDDNGDICYAVVRNTPGCCGNDGLAGLDIRDTEDYPEVDTWVEVVGVVETDIVYGSEIPVLKVASMTVKEEGKSFVTN